MNAATIVSIMKPNITSLGYGLFLAINAAGVWGGVFPFLPMEFQTTEIVFWFFLAQSLVFSFSYFASALGSYFFPGPTRTFIVRLATMPYLLGWCCLIAAIYLDAWALPLVVSGGALLGLGSAGFYMLWQRLFASQDSDAGNHDLILGTAYASVLYFALHLIPPRGHRVPDSSGYHTVFRSGDIVEEPRDQFRPAHVRGRAEEEQRRVPPGNLHLARPALCVGSLGLCAGLIRALAIDDPAIGSLVNALSMGASLVTAVAFMVLWQFKSVRLNVVSLFRIVFPVIITGFVLLPFLGDVYARWLAAVLYAAYSVTIMLMMIQCAQSSRDHGTNPVFVYGFFGGVVYALHDAGFIGGTLAGQVAIPGLSSHAVVALGAGYLLGFMYFFGQGGFHSALRGAHRSVPDVELVSLGPTPDGSAKREGTVRPARKHADGEPVYQDRISKQAARICQEFRLSAREAEVMEHIVRGKTVVRIAEELVISENTVRMHSKRIYAKLDIHKKQDLIDLVDSFDPEPGS